MFQSKHPYKLMRAVTIVFLMISVNAFSQSYKEDVLAIYKNMRQAGGYNMTLHYRLFVDNLTKKEYQSRVIEIKRLRNQLLIKQSNGVEVLENPQHQILVDGKNKLMSVNKKSGKENDQETIRIIDQFMNTKIDTFMMVFDKINVLENSKSKTKYECIYKDNPNLVKITVVVNRKLMQFESVTTEYKNQVDIPELDNKKHTITVEVNYKDFVVNPSFNEELFKSSNYILSDGKGKFKPVNKYSDYKFISRN